MNKLEKRKVVTELRDKFSKAKIALLADYRGLSVAEMTDVRKKLRDVGIDFRVVKNNLAKIASEGTDLEPVKDQYQGPTVVALSYDDVVAPAKILSQAAKQYKHLDIRAGIMEGAVLTDAEILRIATLPSRDELLSMFLRVIQAPLSNLHSVLQAPLRNLVNALHAVKEQKPAA